MHALADQILRVRAERVMDSEQAALLPHLKRQDARRWWSHWTGMARRASEAARFTFNGVAVTTDGLKRRLARVLGRQVDY